MDGPQAASKKTLVDTAGEPAEEEGLEDVVSYLRDPVRVKRFLSS